VHELEDEGAARDDARAAREEVAADDGLEDGGLARGLKKTIKSFFLEREGERGRERERTGGG
jgi:hypothetical protein